MALIKIENRKIGNNYPCFIIAEAGINHNGSFELAKRMVDMAVRAGCDAIKFQTFKGEKMYPKTAGKYETDGKILDIYNEMKKIELPENWVKPLMKYCKNKKIIFFSSVSDIPSVDIMAKHKVSAYKLPSYDTTNLPLLEYTAKKNKPIIMSVGAAYMNEVDEAIRTVFRHNKNLAIIHCVTKYPAPLETCNLNVIETLRLAYPDLVVGYSDHTENPIKAPVAAIVKGAKLIEKHITLDKTMKGPDQRFALNPEQLKLMVHAIRETEEKLAKGEKVKVDKIVLGSSKKEPTKTELYVRSFAYRSIFASRDIKKDERLNKENIEILRNGQNKPGLLPKYYKLLIQKGYKVTRDIKEGRALTWDDLMQK